MISEKEHAVQYMSLTVFISIIFPNMDVNRVSGSKRFMIKYGSRWSFILPFCFILEFLSFKKKNRINRRPLITVNVNTSDGISNVIEPSKYIPSVRDA